MATILRPSRALFRFSGPEAQKLLFDVVTGRLLAESGPPLWWALLSPQGKVQAEGLSTYEDGAFWLDTDQGVADAFHKRMRMYKLRAAVEVADLRATHAVGWDGGAAHTRVTATADEAKGWAPGDDSYDEARIAHGIAEQGPDFAADAVFPHDIGMDFLGGVDFKKGCYIGQEVVSRMEHRGTARRRPVIVSGIDAPAGSAVSVALPDWATYRLGESAPAD